MNCVAHHHVRENRFERLGDQRLQRPALNRKPYVGHAGNDTGVARRHDGHFFRLDETFGGVDAGHRAVVTSDAGDLTLLDDIDSERIGGPCIAPRHRVVARHAGPTLQRSTEHRVARVQVDEGNHLLDLCRCDHFAVNSVESVGVDPTFNVPHVLQAVTQVHHPALAEHHVVVDVLRKTFPQLHRLLVQRRGFVPQVVGTHDRRVTPRVAAAEVAALDHRDVTHAMFLGQVVRSGQPVATGADDDHVIFTFGFGRAPLLLPVLVVRHAVAKQRPDGKMLHGEPFSTQPR